MDQKVLVKEVLTAEMTESGRKLVEFLDSHDWPPDLAAWYFDEEKSRWIFVLSSLKVETHGPRHAYGKIEKAFRGGKFSDLSFEDISIISPKADLCRALKRAVPIDGVATVRFSRNMIDGFYIEDMLIYRNR
jgi:hypothetical protein